MEKRFKTTINIDKMTEYMDTLVSYVFYKLKKDLPQGHDTTYYPAYYLSRKDISDIEDYKHLDEGYKYITITLRKVTNQATIIIVSLKGIDSSDWRYDMLMDVYKRAIKSIESSLDKYFKEECE